MQFPLIRSRFRFFSTRFVQDSPFFSIFHAKKSIQISSGLASPYWNATTIPPVSHPSLLAFYTPNMSHLNMGHLHPSHISLRYSQSRYKTHISIFEIILPYRKFSIQLRHTHWTGPRGLEHFFCWKIVWTSYRNGRKSVFRPAGSRDSSWPRDKIDTSKFIPNWSKSK